MTTFVFGTMMPWLLVGVGALLVFQLIRQNGRILLRLEGIEARLSARPGPERRPPTQGLKPGATAPGFELPDLNGRPHKLAEFRGRDILLLFFNPGCGFCTRMAPDLKSLRSDGGEGSAIPIVVTTGDPDANRRLVAEHGITCLVLLQRQTEVAQQYQAQGTPTGYRIDAAGRIASELTVGAEPLISLASRPPQRRATLPSSTHGAKHKREPDPSLARSRINRTGLRAGTPAPEFRLPTLDGAELALTDFHGRRVLLVFSDPACGPCDDLAPRLQELHETRTDLQVLVISRRDADATRAKAESLGLTYPIVMQKQWELSMKYGMFATPIGYLIDEQGVLLSDVAVGVAPILELADVDQCATAVLDRTSQANGQLLTAN